jgi:hypothetical protein
LDGRVVDELREEGFAVVAEADAAGFDFLLIRGLVVGGLMRTRVKTDD